MMHLDAQKIGIVGLGKSGIAAADQCLARGALVSGFDEATSPSDAARALAERGVTLHMGELDAEALMAHEVIVVSPGMPRRDAIDAAEKAGREVIGELELASRLVGAPIVLIGGTNGKSTVTALVGAMLEAAGKDVFVGGNFGTPLCDAIGKDHDVLVVEISSFQAERVPTLRAKVSALLNVSEDHLDRYDDFAAYAEAKGNPFVNMRADDVAVIPDGDEHCAKQAARGAATVVRFALESDGRELVDLGSGRRFPRSLLQLRGRHNVANACAAIAVAVALDVDDAAIAAGLSSFAGLPHRAVLVAESGGVAWFDDSKATNVGAAVAALRGLEQERSVLIAGGRDKHGSYDPLVSALRDRGRALVAIGEAADRIAKAAEGAVTIVRATTMEDAVAKSAELAEPGDAVLLSPACSSFDMFRSYAARGDAFVTAVRSLLKIRGER
jgi:UDP-N-acetylmuramoylalanine--D-glutamate ligase